MPLAARIGLTLAALWAACPAPGQETDKPAQFAPQHLRTRKELNRREALKLYAMGLISQREDRLLEAVRLFEKALKLDPEAAAIHKALASLYLALERTGDALAACRKVLALDPGDYETWCVYARQLKTQGQLKEARQALSRGVRCAGLKDHPDILQQMQFELGVLYEDDRDYAPAIKAFSAAARVLDKPAALLDAGPFDPAEITAR